MTKNARFPDVKSIVKRLEELPPGLDVDLQGWNSDNPIFRELIEAHNPKIIVEAGVWKGASALHMASLALEAEIYCVDTWMGGIDHMLSDKPSDKVPRDPFGASRLYHQFLLNAFVSGNAERIHPIMQTSVNGAKILAHYGVCADMIYIDASHEYEDVYADLRAYAPLVAPGGIIFGDDFRSFPGVFAAVIRYAHEMNLGIKESADHNFWMLR